MVWTRLALKQRKIAAQLPPHPTHHHVPPWVVVVCFLVSHVVVGLVFSRWQIFRNHMDKCLLSGPQIASSSLEFDKHSAVPSWWKHEWNVSPVCAPSVMSFGRVWTVLFNSFCNSVFVFDICPKWKRLHVWLRRVVYSRNVYDSSNISCTCHASHGASGRTRAYRIRPFCIKFAGFCAPCVWRLFQVYIFSAFKILLYIEDTQSYHLRDVQKKTLRILQETKIYFLLEHLIF